VSQVRINEVMITNTATLADETGAFSPWVELFNSAGAAADLSGVPFSDDSRAPEKWFFPSGPASVVPPRGYIVVFCDGRASGASALHAPFTLTPGPLELVLNKGSDLFFADGSALKPDRSMGRSPDGAERISLLGAPTPGATNGEPVPQRGGIRGDVDRDGAVDITDAIGILDYLFRGTFTPYCEPVADANDDDAVDISDAVRILAFLFSGDPPLADLSTEERAECALNGAPLVSRRPLYHAFPGFPVEFRIEAVDPEDESLLYEAIDPPAGASLEEETGIFRWTPREDQLGPFYVTFVVSDEAVPPNRAGGRLLFQVHPLDGCARPRCDPALGCEPILAPLSEECCGGPGARVSDPELGCPDGRALHVGRNPLGSQAIGRLVNCDLLQLVPLGQGGHVARLNLEARCIAPKQVLLEARLETARVVLFDESLRRDLEARADGVFQLWNLRFVAEGFFTNDTEAQLTVVATDTDGVRIEKKLRVALSRDAVPDLP